MRRLLRAIARGRGPWMVFLTRAPWSALAAVGRGALGEKDTSLVKNMLYNAKMKPYGRRLGEVVRHGAGCPAIKPEGQSGGASHCGAVPLCRHG